LKLVNFGCGGETSASLLDRVAVCRGPGPGGRSYAGSTQIAAAERFLRARRGRVGLVTVSIGGNDVTACAAAPDPVPCVAGAVGTLEANVREIASRLRKAAGKRVPIVGITYPDVILGRWIGPDADQGRARLSVVAFEDLINPALERAYAAAGGRLVDVTRATGAYGSLDELVPLPSGELVPRPVARVCELTYYCEFRDIHARTSGYAIIARLIAGALPKR
jgi:lysophospholipase L1-like esterase